MSLGSCACCSIAAPVGTTFDGCLLEMCNLYAFKHDNHSFIWLKSEFHVYISLNIIEVGELIFHKQISPISRGIRFVSGFLSIRRSFTSCILITLVLLSTLPIGTKYVTNFKKGELVFLI